MIENTLKKKGGRLMDILREVMDASTHAMFLTDAHGIVTHINTQAQGRFGLAG